jgi:hypothetical protein
MEGSGAMYRTIHEEEASTYHGILRQKAPKSLAMPVMRVYDHQIL